MMIISIENNSGLCEKERACRITDSGCPAKIYLADILTDIRYEIFDKRATVPGHIRIEADRSEKNCICSLHSIMDKIYAKFKVCF